MLRTLLTFSAVLAATASECRVDHADAWYEPGVSHHLKHAEGGAIIGASVYAFAATFDDSRANRYALAIGTGAFVGVGYELLHGSARCYIDPVDAGWVTAGAIVGAAVADLSGYAIDVLVNREEGGTTVALGHTWHF